MAKLSTEERNKLTDSDFGIPEKRMYPLHDKAHIEAAVKMFGHAESKYKKSLARKILRRAREYDMDTSGWNQVLSFAQEQVPPMSNGTSIGNSPPRLMAPYYDEQDELFTRVENMAPKETKPPTLDIPYMKKHNMIGDVSSQYTMRPATDSDLDFVYQSELETVGENKDDPKVQRYIKQDAKDSLGHTKIIVMDGNDIGVYQAYETNYYGLREGKRDWWYLAHIYIKPEYRNLGIGSDIIKNDIKNHDKILLQVMKSNTRAKKLYESLGFVVDMENDHGGLIMRLDKSKPVQEAFTDYQEAFDALFILEAEAAQQGVLAKIIDWCKHAIQFIISKIKGLFGVKDSVKTNVDINALNQQTHSTMAQIENGQPVDMNKLDQQLASFKNPHEIKNVQEAVKQINANIELINKSLNKEGLDQQTATALQKLLAAYMEALKNVQDSQQASQGNKTIIEALKKSILTNNANGSSNIQVYPYLYSRTYYIDFDSIGLVFPTELIKNSSDASKYVLKCIRSFGSPVEPQFNSSVTYYNGFYTVLIHCLAHKLAEKVGYKPETFTTERGETRKKFLQDIGGRGMQIYIGYIVSADEIKKNGIPAVSYQMLWNIYLKAQEHSFFVPESDYANENKKRRIPSSLVTIKSNPMPDIKPVQEGAFQDIKNGVNPYSDDLVFHVSPDKHIDGQVWKPRVPDYLDPYNPEEKGFEDNTTPRICFSTSIEGCLNGITVNLQRQSPDTFDKMYVYVPEKPWKEYKHKTNKELVKEKLVYDANVSREVWIMEPVRMKLYGVIRVDQVSNVKRKSVVPTSKGEKGDRNYFTYKWHWVVKPKVLAKGTKFDYSPENVIADLCIDLKKFKYGLIRNGKLQTGNVSESDYEKYWVFHSGQEVDEAGGGNCWDMVEYEAGYLESFGVPYKKYFMNFTKTDGKTPVNTHTICVIPHEGKFIYIEQSFKRITDEWGYERQKTFDSLKEIFQYVADVSAEYENQDLNYGVWDYTDAKIDYGTPANDFCKWIMSKCKMIYDGEADKSEMKQEMNDMFIQLGDSLFYVSEYHNALFDDPDAHDEAINEFGILLDSYDDEVIQEAAFGPYDEYLKKHKYDIKTNTIEDPNRPGKRVSAGRIGSNKERNRMNKFLRENGYDPKTETILTDINDKNNPGQKKRVPFTINSQGIAEHVDSAYQTTVDGKVKRYGQMDTDSINMTPRDIQKKPAYSNATYKHEEGHASQMTDKVYDFERDKPLWKAGSEGLQRRNEAKSYIDDMPYEDWRKIREQHDLDPVEYDADAYSELHNKYAKGDTQLRNLRKGVQDNPRDVNRINKERISRGQPEIVARDKDEMLFAHQKRGEYAQQQYEKRQKQIEAKQTKQRQLSKEQLKQQIASGQLSGDQAAKAERKIQRIEAFEASKQQQPNQQTAPVATTNEKPISVAAQDATKPTIKKEGYRMMNRFGNVFVEEAKEEEMLSDDMEDITIGDLNLEEESEKTKDDDDSISIENETIEEDNDENEEESTSSTEEEYDDPMALPEYLKGRMSEDDLQAFDQPDENLSSDNVDLGQFGKDTSDVQNEYDPKEITILMKLMASEADAMNEYMDGAKETNVDVLRRLYADIANEERFHMEQLLYAKCEMTGEKYVPKDPEVKSEYEELLKMGMDEETAMQTAVDRCHIRGSIADDDTEERIEIQEDITAMEMTIRMFNTMCDNIYTVMESGTQEDVDKAYDVFVEAVYASGNDANAVKFNPIKMITSTIGFLLKTLLAIVQKFVNFCKRTKNHSGEISRFVKQNGLKALFGDKYKVYFIDFNSPDLINDSVTLLLTLAWDTLNASLKTLGFQEYNTQNLPRSQKYTINGDVNKGIQYLNQVQLIKSGMVVPDDAADQERIAAAFFGYNIYKGENAKSGNTLNAMQVMCDKWREFMEFVQKITPQIESMSQQQNSVYYTNKKQYALGIKGIETITKTCKAMVTAIQNDIDVMIKLNNEALQKAQTTIQQTEKRDAENIVDNPEIAKQYSYYNNRYSRFQNNTQQQPKQQQSQQQQNQTNKK